MEKFSMSLPVIPALTLGCDSPILNHLPTSCRGTSAGENEIDLAPQIKSRLAVKIHRCDILPNPLPELSCFTFPSR